jgi:hypothetical protein
LGEQFRQLNKKGQRLQHQTGMLMRRLPNARTALETIANGDHAPEVLKIVREAVNELNTHSVTPEELSLFLGADTPTPTVDVEDLKHYRELLVSLAELDLPPDSDQWSKGLIAMYGLQKVIEEVCPGANAPALHLRNGHLEMFLRMGYLAPLQSCMGLDDAVLRVVATIPFNGPKLEPEVFVRRVREEGIKVAENVDRRQFASSGGEADRYLRLRHHYRLMNESVQQQEYANKVLRHQMAIVKGALEATANGNNDPEVLKLARETLDGFDVSSDPERFMAFFLGADQGAPIPPVDPLDLKHVHEFCEQKNSQHRDASIEGNSAIDAGLMARVCSPGADISAVWLRNTLLSLMVRQSVLTDLQRGTELDDAVYRVAATIPMNGIKLDPKALIQRLRLEIGG